MRHHNRNNDSIVEDNQGSQCGSKTNEIGCDIHEVQSCIIKNDEIEIFEEPDFIVTIYGGLPVITVRICPISEKIQGNQ